MNKEKNSNNKKSMASDKLKQRNSEVKKDLLGYLDVFFEKRMRFFFWMGVSFTFIFSILLFDVKVSQGGDDASFILRAYDFVHSFKLPSYQGPLYPIFISPFIALFGIQLPLLKFLSTIFMVIAFIFFSKAFKNLIPSSILGFVLVLISFNYYILYFASQTFNEAFFMMIQAIFMFYTLKYFVKEDKIPTRKDYLIIGLLLFLMTLTKNVAYGSVIALIGYLGLSKKWKSILYTLGSFLVFLAPWEILKKIVWKEEAIQFSGQGSKLLYKDFYNPTLGKEDFWGLLVRIVDNANLYLSKHFFRFLGWRSDPPDSAMNILPVLTLLVVILLIAGWFLVLKKNKALLWISTYTLCMLLITFVSLQKHWDQWRMIIIVFPFMLMLGFSAIYYFTSLASYKSLQFILPFIAFMILITSFNVTSDNVKVQREYISRNLDGDMLYGLTPDWQNYISMSKYVAKNIPADCNVACRKQEISFIYGQRKFYGIAKVPTVDIDSIIPVKRNDSIVYTMFHLKRMTMNEQHPDLRYKNFLQGIIAGDFAFGDTISDNSNFVGIYRLTRQQLEIMRNDPLIKGIVTEVTDPKAWVTHMLNEKKDIAVFQPDMLYNILKRDKVKYAILASLRLNPKVNNGNIITTLHRYLYFIQLKYPNAFKEIYNIGTEEPCSLIEISLN